MKLFSETDMFNDRNARYKKLVDGGMSEYEAQAECFPPEPLEDLGALHGKVIDVPYAIFYFSPEEFELVKKFFKVATYVENNVPDNSLLIKLLRALESGKLKEGDL